MRFNIGRRVLAYLILFSFLRIELLGQSAQGILHIAVVEGEGTVHSAGQRAIKDPSVKVETEGGRPAVGAGVVFYLPESGPSGEFFNGQRTITLVTNAEGRATATGLKLNNATGPMQVRVTASLAGVAASTVINQYVGGSQRSGGGMSTTAKILIFLAIAGGAAAGAIIATSGKKSSGPATTPPIVITPGTPSVGGLP